MRPLAYVRKLKKRVDKFFSNGTKQREEYARRYKRSPLKPNMILFESFHGMTISDSPLHLLLELMRTGDADKFDIYFATRFPEEHRKKASDLGLPVTLVHINSRKYAQVLAEAKYIVNNSSLPAFFIKREGQVHLQLWHGTPLKTLGKRMRDGLPSMYLAQHNFLQSSYITFPNEFTRDAIMRDYNLEELYTGKVAMMGYPRNDVFHDQSAIEAMRARYGLDGMEVFAYMPTWRGRSAQDVFSRYVSDVAAILSKLDSELRSNQKLFVNFHSFVADKIKLADYEHIAPFPAEVDNYEFLAAADVLITDYSSVMFDFALSGKPVVLFVYDLDEYLSDRGLYFDITRLPFPKVRTTDELVACLGDRSALEVSYAQGEYAEKFLKYNEPDNARLGLSLLFDKPDPVLAVEDFSSNASRPWRVIHPQVQDAPGDIDTVAYCVDPARDIVLFDRPKFTEPSSYRLHDAYVDAFNFVFMTKSFAQTRAESLLARVSKRVARRLEAREQLRLFGPLNITETVSGLFVGEEGARVTAEPLSVPAMVCFSGNEMRLSFEGAADMPTKLFVVCDSLIVWARDVSEHEVVELTIVEDFHDALPCLQGERLLLNVALEVERDGERVFAIPAIGGLVSRDDDSLVQGADSLRFTLADFTREQVEGSAYLKACGAQGLDLLPCVDRQTGAFALLAASADTSMLYVKSAPLVRLSAHRGRFDIVVRVRNGDFVPKRVVMRFRDKVEPTEIELACSMRAGSQFTTLSFSIEPAGLALKSPIWDLYVEGERLGATRRIAVSCPESFRNRTMFLSPQALDGRGAVLFPYTVGRMRWLAFVYRDTAPFDSAVTKAKEVAALVTYAAFWPYWERKRVWLVFEKQGHLAQDNGFYFFKYCMNELPASERSHVYYVLDRTSPDWENVEPYRDQVIEFMSFKHMLYAMVARLYVGSDAKSHLYGWRAKPNVITGRIKRRDILFLQHGVTALKKVDSLFGVSGLNPMTYFLTTSKAEQDIVVRELGYDRAHAPILGFARWDALVDASTPDNRTVLVMPTWREWLDEQKTDQFVKSEYFRAYAALLADGGLRKALARHDLALKFFIHPKLAAHISAFHSDDPRIQLVALGDVALNKLIMECSLLVTDYSSVSWDVLYLGKPVVYYQFDQQLYADITGSFVDLNADLPGPVCKTVGELLDALDATAARGWRLSDKDRAVRDKWFDDEDDRNCERIYRFISGRGY